MASKYFLLFFILITYRTKAQDSIPVAAIENYNYLMLHSYNTIGFGCGASGSETDMISPFRNLMEEHYYDVIKRLLKSNIPANKFIATVVVVELADKRQ